eukprot:CAMPEP_0197518702 /NCGR_PEP_ID=MMETSP1318-20131121/3933_1 /TAXON_ID=552666 /ORGANISM="Partenskyella glossopodia, Strain RCC365" /LENGTH=616 /DNA_ID=CAMNT_0043069247 /DNA_START=603 /DNA_END=2453 /DNA_ORIENTATION=-
MKAWEAQEGFRNWLGQTGLIQIKFMSTTRPGREGLDLCLKLLDNIKSEGFKVRKRHFDLLLRMCVRESAVAVGLSLLQNANEIPVELGPTEYGLALKLCTQDHWHKGKRVVAYIKAKLSILDAFCIKCLQNWCKEGKIPFLGPLSATLNGICTPTSPAPSSKPGSLPACAPASSYQLARFALSMAEKDKFKKLITDHQYKICQKHHRNRVQPAFQYLQRMLDRLKNVQALINAANRGLVLIDAANCGFFNNKGNFRYQQAHDVYKYFKTCGYKTLMFLSHHRSKPHNLQEQRVVGLWKQDNALFVSPTGLNDDAYWMYAAVHISDGKTPVYIVSNDLLRDHHLMTHYDPKFFRLMQSCLVRFRIPKKRGREQTEDHHKRRRIMHHQKQITQTLPYTPGAHPHAPQHRSTHGIPHAHTHAYAPIPPGPHLRSPHPGMLYGSHAQPPQPGMLYGSHAQPPQPAAAASKPPFAFHFPFIYSMQPQFAQDEKDALLLPYIPEGGFTLKGDSGIVTERNLAGEPEQDLPAIPEIIQKRVSWFMCKVPYLLGSIERGGGGGGSDYGGSHYGGSAVRAADGGYGGSAVRAADGGGGSAGSAASGTGGVAAAHGGSSGACAAST